MKAVHWLYWNSHAWSLRDIIVMLKLCHHVTSQHIQELLGAFFKHENVVYNGEQEKRVY